MFKIAEEKNFPLKALRENWGSASAQGRKNEHGTKRAQSDPCLYVVKQGQELETDFRRRSS